MDYQKPLQVRAYESLKDMILEGHLENGQIYSETKISQELGISRTPLRDAIQRLAQERYIDVIPSKGFRLHEMTEKDLLETFQIRCALEGFCVVQLARDHEKPEAKRVIRTLESLLRDQESIIGTTDSIDDFSAYDQEFHERIIGYCENSSITSLFRTYIYQIGKQTRLSLQPPGRLAETVKEHTAIVESLKTGSVEQSYLATMAHLERPKQIIETLGIM